MKFAIGDSEDKPVGYFNPYAFYAERPPQKGSELFLAALSQDAAGQFTPAVESYENSLKSSTRVLFSKVAGAAVGGNQIRAS